MAYENRKAKTLLHFTDTNGENIAGKEVKINLENHEFLFGCGAFDAMPAAFEPSNELYSDRMKKWSKLYNYGTLPFYWGRYELKEGNPHTEELMKSAEYVVKSGAKVKGHPLCWHTVCADWLLKYDNKTILDKQLERINREVSTFKGVIDIWDVINEVVIMPVFDRYDNAITRICKQYGQVNLVKEVFEAAKAANPHALLLINDFNLSEKYAELISDCLDAGVPIGAIGLQTHQHQGFMGVDKLDVILKRFEKFGLPLHFTENTLVSGHLMPPEIVDLNDYQIPEWPTTKEGEERQSREIEEMYRFLFEHPLVKAITSWDFTDGGWLGAPSGVIRTDNSAKPSYDMLNKLINEEWHTELSAKTDEKGYVTIEGYKGEYLATLDGRTIGFTLSDDCMETEVRI